MRVVVLALAFLLLSGCLQGDGSRGGANASSTSTSSGPLPSVPIGCDANRPAIAHGPGGTPVAWDGPLPVPCFAVTPWTGFEPTLGVTKGGLFLFPAYVPTGEGQGADRDGGAGIARSTDRGVTFTRHEPLVAGVNTHPTTLDPFLYVDPVTDRLFVEDILTVNCAVLSVSDDDGETWSDTTAAGCLEWDHVSYAAGPPVTSRMTVYPNLVQRCGIAGGPTANFGQAISCQRSIDGGLSWLPPGEPAFLLRRDGLPSVPGTPLHCLPGAHHATIDHRGWTWIGRDWCGQPSVAVSKDEGLTWQEFAVDDEPGAGHDVAVAVDPLGNVFAFWIHELDSQHPLLAVSQDDGATWTEPMRVDLPGMGFAGSIALSAGGVGKAILSYATAWSDGSIHGVMSLATGLDGSEPVFLTAYVTPPDAPLAMGECLHTMCTKQEDFLDNTIGPDGTPWASFSQDDGTADNGGFTAVGWLHGGPALWDADDPNGPYI